MSIHEFDNGIKVFDDQLLEIQRKRYKHKNVHEEDEEDVFLSIIKNLPQGAIYINVGTAIGYYPLLAKSLRKDLHVHCFEPLPRHLEYFRKNIELNGFVEDDFVVHKIAISYSSCEAVFRDNSYGSSLTTEKEAKVSLKRQIKDSIKRILGKPVTGSAFTVRTIKLSDVFRLIQSDRIDFLHMDIQGFEEPVLNTYFSESGEQCCKILSFLVGTHGPDIHAKCKTLLENAGFQILHDEQDTQHQPDGILLGSLDVAMKRVEQGSGGNAYRRASP